MKIQCTLYRIEPVEQFGEKFKKRIFYVRHQDKQKRTQYLKFQLSQERVDLVEGYAVGDEIDITFELEGRERENDKGNKIIFDSKEVYKIDSVATEKTVTSKTPQVDGGLLLPGEKDPELPF